MNNNKTIKKTLLILCLCLFIFNTTTWTESFNQNDSDTSSNPNIIKLELDSSNEKKAEMCDHCYSDIKDEIHKIYSRTDSAGSRCKHCTRTSKHITEVYTLREVSNCSKGCTYKVIEHLPTENECKRLPEDVSKIIRFNIKK